MPSGRSIERIGKDPVTRRTTKTTPDRQIIEVLDTEGDRRFWLPSAVTILGRKEVEHLIRALAALLALCLATDERLATLRTHTYRTGVPGC